MTNQISGKQRLYAGAVPVEKTDVVGNTAMGMWQTREYVSKGRPVKRIDVCFTEQVIKGIGMKFWGDETQYAAGDWANPRLSNTFISLQENDPLLKFGISTDGSFAKGAVRGLFLQTKKITQWTAGYVSSPYSWLDVDTVSLMGFYSYENVDRFITALGLYVTVRPKTD